MYLDTVINLHSKKKKKAAQNVTLTVLNQKMFSPKPDFSIKYSDIWSAVLSTRRVDLKRPFDTPDKNYNLK